MKSELTKLSDRRWKFTLGKNTFYIHKNDSGFTVSNSNDEDDTAQFKGCDSIEDMVYWLEEGFSSFKNGSLNTIAGMGNPKSSCGCDPCDPVAAYPLKSNPIIQTSTPNISKQVQPNQNNATPSQYIPFGSDPGQSEPDFLTMKFSTGLPTYAKFEGFWDINILTNVDGSVDVGYQTKEGNLYNIKSYGQISTNSCRFDVGDKNGEFFAKLEVPSLSWVFSFLDGNMYEKNIAPLTP